jgi:hypothetical protein
MIANSVVAAQHHSGEGDKAVTISEDRRIGEGIVVAHSTQRSTGDRDNPAVDGQLAERNADRSRHSDFRHIHQRPKKGKGDITARRTTLTASKEGQQINATRDQADTATADTNPISSAGATASTKALPNCPWPIAPEMLSASVRMPQSSSMRCGLRS